MPPVMTFGVTVRSVMRHSLTDGSSPILFSDRAQPPSISQRCVTTAAVADRLLVTAVVKRAERRRCRRPAAPRCAAGRSSPFEGSPKNDASTRWPPLSLECALRRVRHRPALAVHLAEARQRERRRRSQRGDPPGRGRWHRRRRVDPSRSEVRPRRPRRSLTCQLCSPTRWPPETA